MHHSLHKEVIYYVIINDRKKFAAVNQSYQGMQSKSKPDSLGGQSVKNYIIMSKQIRYVCTYVMDLFILKQDLCECSTIVTAIINTKTFCIDFYIFCKTFLGFCLTYKQPTSNLQIKLEVWKTLKSIAEDLYIGLKSNSSGMFPGWPVVFHDSY